MYTISCDTDVEDDLVPHLIFRTRSARMQTVTRGNARTNHFPLLYYNTLFLSLFRSL